MISDTKTLRVFIGPIRAKLYLKIVNRIIKHCRVPEASNISVPQRNSS